MGADWATYENIFDFFRNLRSEDLLMAARIEPCYGALNYLAYLVGGDVHLVNLICAFLMLVGLVKFSHLMNLDACLVLFLSTPYLLFAVGMGYTRQAVAIGIAFAALGYWIRGHHKTCYAAILLAVGFHYSAVFLFLIIAMKNPRRALLIIPCAVLCAFVLIKTLLSNYFSLYVENTEDLHSSGVWLRLAMLLAGAATVYAQRARWRRYPTLFRLLENASVLTISLVPVAFFASTLADRVCLYLFFLYLVALGRVVSFSKPITRNIAFTTLIAATYGIFFLWFGISSYAASSWIPYHMSFWGRSGS